MSIKRKPMENKQPRYPLIFYETNFSQTQKKVRVLWANEVEGKT